MSNNSKKDKRKLVGVYLSLFLIKKAKIYAVENTISLSEVVKRALTEYLKKKK